jgi:hypothetical protein
LRGVARLSGADRKTVRRFVGRARSHRDGDVVQLKDELLAAVIAGVRPSRPNGKSEPWEIMAAQREQIKEWLDEDLTLTKVHTLLGRRGVVVSYQTLHRYATTELGSATRASRAMVLIGGGGCGCRAPPGASPPKSEAERPFRFLVQRRARASSSNGFVAGRTYPDGVARDPTDDFLAGVVSPLRPLAARLIAVVRAHAEFDAGIKWRQLTFAVDQDFDHWICAVAATKRRVNLTFHFGSLLDDRAGVFEASDAKFVRKMGFESVDDVDDAIIRDLLTQAVDALPRFRERS